MKVFSPRTLIAYRHTRGSLTQPRIDRAVRRLQWHGWVLAYHTSVTEPDRRMVAEREDHPFADLMRWTYLASTANPRKMADVYRVNIEDLTGHGPCWEQLSRKEGLPICREPCTVAHDSTCVLVLT